MKITALIMAGGRGERFWPKSRKNLPKQFFSLTNDGKTMIQLTVERILPLVRMEDIFISTIKEYSSLIEEQLPDIPKENILYEPAGRNTAPCIGLGAVHIEKRYKDAVMVVLPSDNLVKYQSMFLNTLNEACELAQEGPNLVTLGITPNYPETGYGYIQFDAQKPYKSAFMVKKVIEKPNLENAKKYLETEQYLWNSGMFVWKASTILKNMKEQLPDIHKGLMNIQKAIGTADEDAVLEREYLAFRSESIDYGIMEKASDIYMIPGTFGWDDVGSWLALERIRKTNEYGNVVSGNVITVDSERCTIECGEKLVATVGLRDMIIVDTEDAILVCAKNSTGDIKKVIENLRICNRNSYI